MLYNNKKKYFHAVILKILALFFLISACFAEEEITPTETDSQDKELEWLIPKKKIPTGYNLTEYRQEPNIIFTYEDRTFKLDSPPIKKGDDIWVALDQILEELGVLFIKLKDDLVSIISYDGEIFELSIGKEEVVLNKVFSLDIPKPLAFYEDSFMLNLDSLSKILKLSYHYDAESSTITFSKEKKEFSSYSIEKPPEVLLDERKEKEKIEKREIKPTALPREIREEYLPTQYKPDIDLRLNASFKYFHDMYEDIRTRYTDYYLTGDAYDVSIYGNLSLRDDVKGDKRTFIEDGQHVSFFKEGSGLKLLDNFVSFPHIRSQSQAYWGGEFVDSHSPIVNRNIFRIGRLDPISISSLTGSGTIKYFGDLYSLEQNWVKDESLDISSMVSYIANNPEFDSDRGDSIYPRRNLVYLLDSRWLIYPGLNFYNTFAHSNYNRDDKPDKLISDFDYRTAFKFEQERYTINTFFEYVGDEYASLGIPATYQDYLGGSISSGFNITDNWALSLGADLYKNNVDDVGNRQTTYSGTFSVGNNFILPWSQGVNVYWTYNKNLAEGADEDARGTEYNSFRADYYKDFGTLSARLGYQYFRSDPLGGTTGSNLYHLYSLGLYKYFPNLNNSYLRLYQDMTKKKQLSSGSIPTTTTWSTNLGSKLYILRNLSIDANCRLRTTQRDDLETTSDLNLQLGTTFKPLRDTTIEFVYFLSDVDLMDKYRDTKNYSIMFTVRHIFDIKTREKWGKVGAYVFEDKNNNDIRDPGEGLKDVLVYVVGGRHDYTDAGGQAYIKKVVPGPRKVKVDIRNLPVDMIVKGPSVKEVNVESFKKAELSFPIVSTGTIEGRVFVDRDRDGIFNKVQDIPLPNVRVFLRPKDRDTLTFSDGSYIFDYAFPGEVSVNIDRETVPEEYVPTSPESLAITLHSREELKDINFIFQPKKVEIEYFD